jgi:hypothetical protein
MNREKGIEGEREKDTEGKERKRNNMRRPEREIERHT